jgi:Tfp pilus assembly protein PilN
LEEEILKSETEVKSMQQVFETLRKGEFGNTKGYSEYLRAYSRQIVGGVWLTGLSIYGAGNEIGIKGRATRPELIPTYISRLKSEAVMQGKTFATLEMQVPEAEQTNKADSTAAKAVVLANFIDFNLQSVPSVKESAGPAEGVTK